MFDIGCNTEAREALGIPASLNSFFGLWPLDKPDLFLKIRWFISTVLLIGQVACAAYESSLSCEFSRKGLDNLLILTFGCIGLAKMIFYYKHREKLQLNVVSAIEDWSSDDAVEFSEIMNSRRSTCNILSRGFLVGALITAIAYPMKVFVFSSDPMEISTSNSDDHNENFTLLTHKTFLFPLGCSAKDVSRSFHWVIIFAQFFAFIVAVGVNLSCDTFFTTITHHLCGQYIILKRKFVTFEEFEDDTKTREKLGILSARHHHLLNLSNLLEASFNMIMLAHIIMNLVLINVAGVNLLFSLKKGEVSDVVFNILIINFALVQTYLYSHMGDELSNHGSDIIMSVYNCTWQTMPKNFRKDLIFVMARAGFSFHLTAGKLLKMTRGSFTDIVKTAVSYLSVLRVIADI